MSRDNILLMTDSYKVSHWKQYPPKTTRVFSYLESRGGEFPSTTFFGLQYIIKRYLEGAVVTQAKITEAKEFYEKHFGQDLFNLAGWTHILKEHGGKLPVIISAVPEGTIVPTGNVLLTIENTDPAVPWLTNYLETLLCQVWYPTTVCTQSRAMKDLIRQALLLSGDVAGLDFKLHDFGYRGSTSVESAALGGAAHLVNFKGTDTVAALTLARDYYAEPMAGFSIPAAEHSTITSWGRDREVDAFANMLEQYPKGLVAVVSDSYNIFDACAHLWGEQLKDKVLARDGVLVVRPDSGDPPTTVCSILGVLDAAFGSTENSKGYKVLNPKVRVIQGDGIDYQMLGKIIDAMLKEHWSVDNIAFGSGGGLLQKVNRDTCRFAFKCSAIEIDGEWQDVYKQPVGMDYKKSKRGRLKLVDEDGFYFTKPENYDRTSVLQTVFKDGVVGIPQTFGDVIARAA